MVFAFFVFAYAITWLCQLPFVLARAGWAVPPALIMPLLAIGAVGPALAALLLSRPRRIDLRAPSQPLWQFVAVLLPPALALVAGLLFAASGGTPHWLAPSLNGPAIGIALLSPLGEELGWRGYALPRLQQRLSPLWSSVLIGVLWCFWHTPYDGLPHAADLVWLISLSICFTWLYNSSGGNLRVAVLAHFGIHLSRLLGVAAGTPLRFVAAVWVVAALLIAISIHKTDVRVSRLEI